MPSWGSGPVRSGTNSTKPRPRSAEDVEQRVELGVVGMARGHRPPRAVLVEERGRQAPGAVRHRGVEDLGHRGPLGLGRGPGPRVVAHHDEAQRRVAHEGGDVEADALGVDRVAVPGVVVPRPRHVVGQGVGGDVLDEREHVGDGVTLLVDHGEQRQRAVPRQRGRDAVLRVRVARGVPEQLGVEVGMGVDEPGRDERARRRRAPVLRRGAAMHRPRRCDPPARARPRAGTRRRCRRRRSLRARGDRRSDGVQDGRPRAESVMPPDGFRRAGRGPAEHLRW